ncbi:MAG: hypothetical protein ACRDYC_04625, partial [Acidimicrobiales bacterium]
PRRPYFTQLAVSALIVGLVILLGWAVWTIRGNNDLGSARQSALAAARGFALQISTYQYEHLSQEVAAIDADSTAEFKAHFDQAVTALTTILAQQHASASGTIRAVGLVSATMHKAVAVAFVDESLTFPTTTKAATQATRLKMTLVRQSGRWMLDGASLI